MPKRKQPKPQPYVGVVQHTIRVPAKLEERVQRAMELEGLQTYNDFALSAFTRRCRQIERDHIADTEPSQLKP